MNADHFDVTVIRVQSFVEIGEIGLRSIFDVASRKVALTLKVVVNKLFQDILFHGLTLV